MSGGGLPPPDECAVCGAAIPRSARACPECGADERTGWREQDIYDGLDLPQTESAEKPERRSSGLLWKITGVVLLVLMAVLAFRGW